MSLHHHRLFLYLRTNHKAFLWFGSTSLKEEQVAVSPLQEFAFATVCGYCSSGDYIYTIKWAGEER